MSDSPVKVTVPADEGQNNLWGIPFLGLWARAILVIPQGIILFFVAIAAACLVLVSWIPILLSGRMAAGAKRSSAATCVSGRGRRSTCC